MSLLQRFRKNRKTSTNQQEKTQSTRDFGFNIEARAIEHLKQKGFEIIETNYSCRKGEIDIIVRRQSLLVFVEVRYRASEGFGGASASVNKTKQRRILSAVRHFIATHKQYTDFNLRIDVMAFNGSADERNINWIENAFTENGYFI